MQERNTTAYRNELRLRVLQMAIQAFTEQGIRAVKMDDIAQTLGISKRTLYELYDNKEVLLLEVIRNFKVQKEREAIRLAAESANVMDLIIRSYRMKVEEFRHINPLFFSELEKYPSVMSYLEEDKKNSQHRILAFLKRGVKEGYFRRDVDYGLVTKMLEGMGEAIRGQQLYRQYPIEHLLRNLMFVGLRGFCTKSGVDILDKFLKETA